MSPILALFIVHCLCEIKMSRENRLTRPRLCWPAEQSQGLHNNSALPFTEWWFGRKDLSRDLSEPIGWQATTNSPRWPQCVRRMVAYHAIRLARLALQILLGRIARHTRPIVTPSPIAEYCDERVCLSMCVCLCVCLFTTVCLELLVRSSPKFLRMLPMAVARSSRAA